MEHRRHQPIAVGTEDLPNADAGTGNRDDCPSVGDAVVDYLAEALGVEVEPALAEALRTAVLVALEVADRYRRRGGRGLSTVAMRSDARVEARLVTHLRRDPVTARCALGLCRLLIGSDRTPPESGLLWWVARGRSSISELDDEWRRRWRFDVRQIDHTLADAAASSQPARATPRKPTRAGPVVGTRAS
jgi:hypothetical protein